MRQCISSGSGSVEETLVNHRPGNIGIESENVALFILRLPLEDFWKEVVLVFFLGTAVMLMLFWFPPVDICKEGEAEPCLKEIDFEKRFGVSNPKELSNLESTKNDIILAEHNKTVEEIKLRIEREDD